MVNTAFMYLAGTFTVFWALFGPPQQTSVSGLEHGVQGPHVDACPGVDSAGQHQTGHAGTSMPCRPKSMSGAAMTWLSPPSRSQTHGLLMPKTGCPHRLGPKKVMGSVWRKTEVWGTTSNTSIIHERYMAITAAIHS